MNILQLARTFPPTPGGAENHVLEISVRLSRRGHKVSVYTSNLLQDLPFRTLPHDWSDPPFPFALRRFMPVPVPKLPRTDCVAPKMLFSILRGAREGLIHFHGLDLFTVSALPLVKPRNNCKLVCTTHIDPKTLSRAPIPKDKILDRFDGLVALTDVELRRLVDLGIDESKLRLIPLGIDTEAFKNLPSRMDFRKERCISGNMVLYSGRIDPYKGCDTLVQAMANLSVKNSVLVFAGPDWGYQSYLENLCRRLGVKAVFTGNLSPTQVRSALVACDVFVLPSLSEALGLSILEAMLSGAPVVATNVGGIPTLVHHEETGLLVRPADPGALADAISRVLINRGLSARLAASAKKLASTYPIERTVIELEKFYRDIF